MTTDELKNLAHVEMVNAMTLLKSTYEAGNMEVANAEAKERLTADILARYEHVYPVYEGSPFFEGDMDIARENYEEARRKAILLHCELEQIDNAMMALRKALNIIEITWYYEE